jgi:hypothetical protein
MRHNILLGIPGRPIEFGCALGIASASMQHHIELGHAKGSWDNFNTLFAGALTLARQGKITHFAQLHADVAPSEGWVDVLVAEMERRGASFCSATCAIKDGRGVLSCGVGNEWNDPWRGNRTRFTVWESLHEFPETFDAADVGYRGLALLHNNGCFVCDLRDERFYAEDDDGGLRCCFTFPKRIVLQPSGEYRTLGVSEDWWFSWQMHRLGIPSVITRKVVTKHGGENLYPNNEDYGTWRHDEDAERIWAEQEAALEGETK